MKRLTIYEPVEFSDVSYTEKGEKVYKTLKIEFHRPAQFPVERTLECDKGIGITEEWIEDTILGCLIALKEDYPQETFTVTRLKPNYIKIESQGVVN